MCVLTCTFMCLLQLVYEIGDPTNYVLPDVCCDFSHVTLEELKGVHMQFTLCIGFPPVPYMQMPKMLVVLYWSVEQKANLLQTTTKSVYDEHIHVHVYTFTLLTTHVQCTCMLNAGECHICRWLQVYCCVPSGGASGSREGTESIRGNTEPVSCATVD